MMPNVPFVFTQINACSSVDAQPKTSEETLAGAHNRVDHARILDPSAHFYVGLEGGVELVAGELHEFAWIVVESANGRTGIGKTATFIAPPIFAKMVFQEGMEVGDISDVIFGQKDSKKSIGAIGLLTKGAMDRVELYRHGVIVALIPFVQKELYLL